MSDRLHWLLAVPLVLSILASPGSASQTLQPGLPAIDDADIPQDLVLAVDISKSMTSDYTQNGRSYRASDPEGMRWDGVQFAIDLARPGDRIALVLFRADAAVVTKFIDPSGYVRLDDPYPSFGGRTGRELLKAVVSEIQDQDQDKPGTDKAQYSLATLGGQSFKLWMGTSTLNALRTIDRAGLLKPAEPGRRAWALLFTDGVEAKPFPFDGEAGHQYPCVLEDYAYIDGRETLLDTGDQASMARWFEEKARPIVEKFRANDLPVMTFGLGGQCDRDLLRRISEGSQAPGLTDRPAASYNPVTNVDMLDTLQRVEWELRRQWRMVLDPAMGPQLESFRSPPIGVWHDMGLLVYRHRLIDGRPEPRALAPIASDVRPPRLVRQDAPPDPVPGLSPRVSRSHWYYFVGPHFAGGKLPIDAEIELAVRHATKEPYVTRLIAAVRTRTTRFEYREPASGSAFSPKDAIPIRVDFESVKAGEGGLPGQDSLRAEDFEVEATLTPATETSRISGRSVKLTLAPADPSTPGRTYRHQFVLDESPDSDGSNFKPGPYFVDLVIRGLAGPLKRAERRLIRRIIAIGEYPRVTLPKQVLLTNESGRISARPVIETGLGLDHPSDLPIAQFQAEVTRGPDAGPARQVEASRFFLDPARVTVVGREGRLAVGLVANAWRELEAGKTYTGGELKVVAPWAGESREATSEIVVIKRPYRVATVENALRFDLSGQNEGLVRKELHATLSTDLETEEEAWLAVGKDRDSTPRRTLTFERVDTPGGSTAGGPPASIDLPAEGLGTRVTLRPTGGGRVAVFSIGLGRVPGLNAGDYRSTLYLVGPSIEPTPVAVQVLADQPRIMLIGDDGKPRPITDLYLVGLAGTRERRELVIGSSIGQTLPGVEASSAAIARRDLGDSLPNPRLVAKPGEVGRFTLEIEPPRSVLEGWYESPLTFRLTSGALPLVATLPIHFQVVHRGVRVDPAGPLRIVPEPECGREAIGQVQLRSDVERSPIRWWVEAVKVEPGTGASRPLPEGRIDVRSGEPSVLGPKAPNDPVLPASARPLTVVARCEGLEPGPYRSLLRFHSSVDEGGSEEGPPADLEVEVLVPGRVLEFAGVEGGRPRIDSPMPVRVVVASYGCEPGKGELVPVDAEGRAVGASKAIDDSTRTRSSKDPKVALLQRDEYLVQLTPSRAGKGELRVRWPALCAASTPSTVAGSASGTSPDRLERRVAFEAAGKVEVRPSVLYSGENAEFRLALDPSSVTTDSRSVTLRAVNSAEAEKVAVAITLTDSGKPAEGDLQIGDGKYAGQSKELILPGDYDVRPETATNFPVEPATARVGFELKQNSAAGTINYGGGQLIKTMLGIDERLSVPDTIKIVNRLKTPCEYRVRLLFPLSAEDGRNLENRDLASVPTANGFDPKMHLDANLVGRTPGSADSSPARELAGSLPMDGSLSVGVDARLSEDALTQLYGEIEGSHPTLGYRNGMLVEVQLRWTNGNDTPLTRTLLIPVTVTTTPWYWRGMVASVIVAVVLVGIFWLLRRFKIFGSGSRTGQCEGESGGRKGRSWPWPFGSRTDSGSVEDEDHADADSNWDQGHSSSADEPEEDDPWTQHS